ncbi:MAG TPA: GGDEF domain-containing protein [Streptosporangiaceae bacterium]|jgi:diguanylate cyclase (GGDEF)-like protein|nr:GGDEF domain-containing protein [Streptosporangiaceae bacterium]
MAVIAEDKARLLAEFPLALENGQLVAYFQPEFELSSGRVVAVESLARWEHPDLGILPPALFAPIAEQLGLMGELTRLMLRLSLGQHRRWASGGWHIPVSVNVGPDCVGDPEFPALIAEFLRHEKVPGSMLALEVSEQTGTAAVSASFFAQLAELGVCVALDDFGTGFASLESLGGWPIDELKLDMSLIRPIATNPSFRMIVRNTIDLAHQLGVKVVAEGVESEAVRSELQALGCDLAQGFLFGRPMPADIFADWLVEHEQPALRRGGAGHRATAVTAVSGGSDHVSRAYRRLKRAGRRAADQVGPRTLTAVLAMLVVYGLWQVFRWGGHRHQALIGDLAFIPLNSAVAVCAWQVSLRRDLGQATCRAWRLLSVALWLYMLGDVLQFFYENVFHLRAYPTWADAAYLSFYIVAFAGLSSFPSRRRTGSERTRLLLDMGTVFVGGATFIWYVALGPAVTSAHGFDLADLVTFAYPVGDLLLLFGVLSLLWRGTLRSSLLSLRIVATGLTMFIAADVTYDYITVNSTYLGGDPVDTLWFVALAIMWIAASCQLHAEPQEHFATPPRDPAGRPSVLPYLAVAGSYLLLMVVGLENVSFNPLGGILLGALVLTVLVSLRQFAALRDNGRLARRYQELASIDEMTGLYSRRHFMEVAESAFAHAQRLGQPLVALMIDVDNFKEINDLHGHAIGDQVLADLARSCREQVRPDDIAGRYGGDEFIIMIPGTTTLRATQIAARLTGPPTRVTGSDGTPVSFTASIGIAESARCGDLPSLLTRADTAMYQAKRGGGACWRAFDGHHTGAGSGPADQVSTDVAGLELVEDQDGVSG